MMRNRFGQSLVKNEQACEKIELANSCGVRIIYCQDCHVVELEIGAISVRLCPDVIQRIANIMMKASLQLDHIAAVNKQSSPSTRPQMIH